MTVEGAMKEGSDVSTNLQATLECAKTSHALIVIGILMTAVGIMLDTISEHIPSCGIMDVVSVKAAVVAEVSAHGMEERSVGAHPMTGSVQAGWPATFGGLFDDAFWVITYDPAVAADAAGKPTPERWIEVLSQIANLGAAPGSQLILALDDHRDASVTRISHMPYLATYAIAAAGKTDGPLVISLVAGSFRDCACVIAAAPDMVMPQCGDNIEPVLVALDDAIERLTTARTQLATGGTTMGLARIGRVARVRYEARPAHRPIFRLRTDEDDWINQLKLTESVSGQVNMPQCGTIFSSELYTSLTGITAINFAINVPGPLAIQYSGRLGAWVIKVGPLIGDPLGAPGRLWYEVMSVGRETTQTDLKSGEGRTQLSLLIDEADVATTSVRPSALERTGLAGFHEHPNGPIHIDIVGDTDAPEIPGHDLTCQAETGALTPPAMPSVSLGDTLDAHLVVIVALAGLIKWAGAGVDVVKQPGLHYRIGLKQAGEAGVVPLKYGMAASDGLLGGDLWTYGLYPSTDGYVAMVTLESHFIATLTRATGVNSREGLAASFGERTDAEIMWLASEKALPLAVAE